MNNIKITTYTIPTCPYCITAKKWLDEHNLEYEDITVPSSKSQRQILDQFTKYFPDDARGVPVIVVEKEGQKSYFNDETDPKLAELVL